MVKCASDTRMPSNGRPVRVIVASTVSAAAIELLGRLLYQVWGVGYAVTGSLTLLALVIWAGSAIYMVRWAPNVPRVTRAIVMATCLLVLSQAASMGGLVITSEGHPVAGLSRFILGTVEEGFFVCGLALLIAGLYLSVLEAAKAKSRLLQESEVLAAEVEERRRAVAALRESEEKYRTLVDSAPNGVLIVQDARIVFANASFASMFGLRDAKEAIGQKPFEFVAPVDRERLAGYERDRLRGSGETPKDYEAVLRRKDGEELPALVFVRQVMFGGRLAVQVVVVDMSARKQAEEAMRRAYAEIELRVQERTLSLQESNRRLEREVAERQRVEEALRQSERKYRVLIESLSEVVYRVSLPDGACEYMGPSAILVFGYTPQILMSEPFYLRRVVHPDSLHAFDEFWEGAKQGSVPDLFEYRILDPQGAERWIGQSNSLVRDSEGTPVAVEGICRDITEQKRAQHLIEEHRTLLLESSKMSVLGEMAASIAHEINNPLNVVSGSAEQLQLLVGADRLVPEIACKLTDAITRNVFRIKRIIHGLRSFTRSSAQDPFRRAHMRTIVEDTVALCSHRFTSHEVTLYVAHVPDSLVLECRAPQIMEVLTNLLSNSLHAVEGCRERWVSIEVADLGDWVELSVTDSGRGISPDVAGNLFEPFVTTKVSGKGMGLGLSVSKRIVESHRGCLVVDSDSPHTRFVVRLPKWQQASHDALART